MAPSIFPSDMDPPAHDYPRRPLRRLSFSLSLSFSALAFSSSTILPATLFICPSAAISGYWDSWSRSPQFLANWSSRLASAWAVWVAVVVSAWSQGPGPLAAGWGPWSCPPL